MKKTKLILRWERDDGRDLHETIWERKDDGQLYFLYASILALVDVLSKVGPPPGGKL